MYLNIVGEHLGDAQIHQSNADSDTCPIDILLLHDERRKF